MKELLNYQATEEDNTFWMSFEDVLKNFKSLSICRVKNWEEVRIKGKYIRVQDIDDPNVEVVLSKWYYSVVVEKTTHMIITLHQEDERINGVLSRRPYIDAGIAILKRVDSDKVLTLYELKDFVCDR